MVRDKKPRGDGYKKYFEKDHVRAQGCNIPANTQRSRSLEAGTSATQQLQQIPVLEGEQQNSQETDEQENSDVSLINDASSVPSKPFTPRPLPQEGQHDVHESHEQESRSAVLGDASQMSSESLSDQCSSKSDQSTSDGSCMGDDDYRQPHTSDLEDGPVSSTLEEHCGLERNALPPNTESDDIFLQESDSHEGDSETEYSTSDVEEELRKSVSIDGEEEASQNDVEMSPTAELEHTMRFGGGPPSITQPLDDDELGISENENDLDVRNTSLWVPPEDIFLEDEEDEDVLSISSQENRLNDEDSQNNELDVQINDNDILPAPPVTTFERLNSEILGKYNNVITEAVNATFGEVMLNALELCKHHNFNHLEKTNLMKFVNTIFQCKVVPDTRYLLDELLFDKEGCHYYFYCNLCSTELGKVNVMDHKTVKEIQCPNDACKNINIISDLSTATFFALFDIPHQIQLLLQDANIRSKLVNPYNYKDKQSEFWRDIYDGEFYSQFAASLDYTSGFKFLSFCLCTDGSPLFSFSSCSIWPCFLSVNELPSKIRMENFLLAGLWFGNEKAKMDLFLKPIIEHIKEMSTTGFCLRFHDCNDVWKVKAYLIACCVDSGARGEVQCIHSHRGEYSCNWCLHPGVEFANARKFPVMLNPQPEERSLTQMMKDAEEAIRTEKVVNGVKGPSQLSAAPRFHIVWSMIVEYMHILCEGNAKRFFNEWFKDELYLGAAGKQAEVERRIRAVRPPVEVRKYMRSTNCSAHWTGREWENWILHFSVPILEGLLPAQFLKNWALLAQATSLLLRTEISSAMLNVAHCLLLEFAIGVESLYGLKMMRFNVHVTQHLAENVKRWGPLQAISAFSFEYGIMCMKKLISANNGIPNQVARAFSLDQALCILRRLVSTERTKAFADMLQSKRISKFVTIGPVKLLGGSAPYINLTQEEVYQCNQMHIEHIHCLQYLKISMSGIVYQAAGSLTSKSRSDNSVAKLDDGRIVQIKYFIFNEISQRIWLVAFLMRVMPFMCSPEVIRLGSNACFLLKVRSIDEDLLFLPVEQLNGIYVNLKFPHGHFLSPIPNLDNTF